jgi:hypothetical protein
LVKLRHAEVAFHSESGFAMFGGISEACRA